MQTRIENIISNIVSGNGGTHAYIVEGTDISKRDAFLKSFIKGILCENSMVSGRACNSCRMCKQIDADTCLDYIRMRKSGKTGYKVSDAEEFISRLSMGSYGRKLIGVVDNAELLGEIIENKLLKTLEEPPENTIILLAVANSDNLLQTVRSRCSTIREADYIEDLNYQEAYGFSAAETLEDEAAAPKFSFEDFSKKNFYEFRTAVSKKLKTKEDALLLLCMMEDQLRENMLKGGDADFFVRAIERISNARMDISLGMSYDKALKRLYLELLG